MPHIRHQQGKGQTVEHPKGYSLEMRNKGICGIIAIALAANVDVASVHQVASKISKEHCGVKRFSGGMYNLAIVMTLVHFNVAFDRHDDIAMTLQEFCALNEACGQMLLVQTDKHIMTFVHGKLIDQARNYEWWKYPRLNDKVLHVYTIKGFRWGNSIVPRLPANGPAKRPVKLFTETERPGFNKRRSG